MLYNMVTLQIVMNMISIFKANIPITELKGFQKTKFGKNVAMTS